MPRCKSCDAEIKFIRTEKGRAMPVDIKPITAITSLGKTIKAFTPHWGNCQGSDTSRKQKPEGSSRAAYEQWNEDADRIRYAENPEIFGR